MWSKYKPVRFANGISDIENIYRASDGNCGLNIPITNTIKKAIEQGALTHAAPRGGENEPFRLGDWKGYSQSAIPFIHLENEGEGTYELNIAYEEFISFYAIYEGDTHSGIDYRDMAVFDESVNTPYFWYYEIYAINRTTGEEEDYIHSSYISEYPVFLSQGMNPGKVHTFLLSFEESYWDDTYYVYFGMYNKGTNSALPLPYTLGIPGVPQYGYKVKIKVKNVQDRVLTWHFLAMVAFNYDDSVLSTTVFMDGTNEPMPFRVFDSSKINISVSLDNKRSYPINLREVVFKILTSDGYSAVEANLIGVTSDILGPGEVGTFIYESTVQKFGISPPLGGVVNKTIRMYYEGQLQGEARLYYTMYR